MFHSLRALTVFVLLSGFAIADEKQPVDKKPTDVKPPMIDVIGNFFKFPPAVKLTDEQQKQLEKMKEEYGAKMKSMMEKTQKIMTPERMKAQQEAFQKALKDGLKGMEIYKAVQEAMKLTDDEKKLMEEQGKLFQEVNKKKFELLTEEQKKQLFTPIQPKPPVDKK